MMKHPATLAIAVACSTFIGSSGGGGGGALVLLFTATALSAAAATTTDEDVINTVFSAKRRAVVTNQAMGARCAVSADFDGDGLLDLVSASSNDNAVSWYQNLGSDSSSSTSLPTFSIKNEITWSSLGSRIVTVGDVDGDGDVDVVGASYYDSSLRWFENDGTGTFTEHLISDAVDEGQGVTLADLDNDGDPDIASASSGDNTIAVFKNIDHGIFCEVKEVVDDDAIGARTVIAADLNGDGWLDLASASKDDDSVSWYPNDGTGHFPKKIVISRGEESAGAYSLVAVDIDKDGDQDLVVASNGNDHVSIWRNDDGLGSFSKTLVFDNADFVLSVTAADFDRDGDIDIASASFFDGHINWYENIDGEGYEWRNHTIYVGTQGHYVHHGDMDGDGDMDLIAIDHAENSVTVFFAETDCDGNNTGAECCLEGSEWNGTSCGLCPMGKYGTGSGVEAQCVECPSDQCTIPGLNLRPTTCRDITGCMDIEKSLALCSCAEDSVKDPETDGCTVCPEGQVRPDIEQERGLDTLGNYTAWELQQGTCTVPKEEGPPLEIIIPVAVAAGLIIMALSYIVAKQRHVIKYHTRDVNNAPQDGTIAIVFTDIEGSTALWDISKDTMSKALEIHHDVIRRVIDRHNAYEVKTIGDSFMVALSSADAAILLANDIQQDLLDANWPVELANMPSAGSEFVRAKGNKGPPKLVSRGLRVRIGVHMGNHSEGVEEGGQVQTKYDKVAKGYDYYGPAVNAAARIEAMAFGGQSLMSSEIFAQLSDGVKEQCLLHVVGGLCLKGIEDEVFVYQCLPRSLKGRTFKGVFRRRDSEGGSIAGDSNADFMITRGASIVLGSFLEDEDLTGDIMTLTPVQLQNTVSRLRNKVRDLDQKLAKAKRRESDDFSDLDVDEEFSGNLENGDEE
ncbi:hypothetical protein ACHAXR_006063, partial [Thalassiosira sp. AJA248-18]